MSSIKRILYVVRNAGENGKEEFVVNYDDGSEEILPNYIPVGNVSTIDGETIKYSKSAEDAIMKQSTPRDHSLKVIVFLLFLIACLLFVVVATLYN